jgi:putative NADH-flavin reductase
LRHFSDSVIAILITIMPWRVPMIVITTPAGQVGRQVLGNLLESGEQLRVIARDPSQLPAGVREDLDIVEGSHGDAAVVDRAFAGADAVLWVTSSQMIATHSSDPGLAGNHRQHGPQASRAIITISSPRPA